jgi:glutathione S-transferase
MLQWGFWSAVEIERPATPVLYHGAVLPPEQRDPAAVRTALETLEAPLRVLEDALKEGGGHLVGRRFTVADLNAICCVFYLRSAPSTLESKPAIRAWYEASMARPANRAAFALRAEEECRAGRKPEAPEGAFTTRPARDKSQGTVHEPLSHPGRR